MRAAITSRSTCPPVRWSIRVPGRVVADCWTVRGGAVAAHVEISEAGDQRRATGRSKPAAAARLGVRLGGRRFRAPGIRRVRTRRSRSMKSRSIIAFVQGMATDRATGDRRDRGPVRHSGGPSSPRAGERADACPGWRRRCDIGRASCSAHAVYDRLEAWFAARRTETDLGFGGESYAGLRAVDPDARF